MIMYNRAVFVTINATLRINKAPGLSLSHLRSELWHRPLYQSILVQINGVH